MVADENPAAAAGEQPQEQVAQDPLWTPEKAGKVPASGALYCGKDVNGKPLFFARAQKPDGTVWLGKVGNHYKGCWYINTETSKEELAEQYEVLCLPGDQWKWVSVSLPLPEGQVDSDSDFGGLDVLSDNFSMVPTARREALSAIPENAFAPGRDTQGRPLYVARMLYKNVLHAGVAAPHITSGCHVAYAGDQSNTHFDVLVPVTPEDRSAAERAEFLAVYDGKMEAGKNYALVGSSWMNQWLSFARLNDFFKTPDLNVAHGLVPESKISNRALVDGFDSDDDDEDDAKDGEKVDAAPAPAKEYTINRFMDEYRDYYLLNEAAYELLKKWYGSDLDLLRPALETQSGSVSVEFNPTWVKVTRVEADGTSSTQRVAFRGTWTWQQWAAKQLAATDKAAVGEDEAKEAKEDEHKPDVIWERVGIWWWESPLPKGPEVVEATPAAAAVAVEGEAAAAPVPAEELPTERWQTLGPKLRTQSLEEFKHSRLEVQGCSELRITLQVRANAEEPWALQLKAWDEFAVGDVIDALDTSNKWYEAVIEAVTKDEDGDTVLRVHYLGWARKYDINLSVVDKKQPRRDRLGYMLAPRNTNTLGQYEKPKPKPVSTYPSYSSGYSSGGYWGGYSRTSTKGKPPAPGAVGLVNLGNTCFMNSTLSSMLHARPLRDYMLSDGWKQVLNRDSVLGWKGEAAEQFAALTKEFWSGDYTVVAPSNFKEAVGKYKPRFAGFAQQDSSELLSELLEGLDEDLNRVTKKPPTDKIESDGRPDAEVALDSWRNHLKRNDSVIQEIFSGQVKSTVDCPDCPRVSVTFDPITYFSVPVPSVNDKRVTVFVKFADPNRPLTKFSVKAVQTAFMTHVKRSLADLINEELPADAPRVSPGALFAGDIWQRKIHRWMDETSVSRIMANDVIVVYETPENAYVPLLPEQAPALTAEELAQPEKALERPGAALASLIGDQPTQLRLADVLPVALVNNVPDPQYGWNTYGQPIMVPVHYKGDRLRNCDLWASIIRQMFPFFSAEAKAEYNASGRVPFKVLLKDSSALYCGLHNFGRCVCMLPLDAEPFKELLDKYADSMALDQSFVLRWDSAELYDTSFLDPSRQVVHASAQMGVSAEADEGRGREGRTTLSACLDAFTQEEVLEESEAWYCSGCKDHKCAKKKFDLWKLPEVMIIHLKRFHYTRVYRDKVTTHVEFPLEGLSLRQWCRNPEHEEDAYDLFAVSNHSGGMGGGHYTAYVRNADDGRWYMHNDESVSSISNPDSVVTNQAYLLFYQRRPRQAAQEEPQQQQQA